MNTPSPRVLTTRTEVFGPDNRRVAIVNVITDTGMLDFASPPTFQGLGVAMLTIPNPADGGRTAVNQPHPFAFPIDAKTIGEAFDKWDAAQTPGWDAEFQRLKVAALKQGADMSQMPQEVARKAR